MCVCVCACVRACRLGCSAPAGGGRRSRSSRVGGRYSAGSHEGAARARGGRRTTGARDNTRDPGHRSGLPSAALGAVAACGPSFLSCCKNQASENLVTPSTLHARPPPRRDADARDRRSRDGLATLVPASSAPAARRAPPDPRAPTARVGPVADRASGCIGPTHSDAPPTPRPVGLNLRAGDGGIRAPERVDLFLSLTPCHYVDILTLVRRLARLHQPTPRPPVVRAAVPVRQK